MPPRPRSAPPQKALTLALALMLSASLPALASTPQDALRAADPATPTQAWPLSMPDPQRLGDTTSPESLEQARLIWQQAHQRVADFPRGHIDLLRWESAQARPREAAPAAVSEPLGLGEALRASLRQRPDLFTHAGMNALAVARTRMAYAAHVRELQHAWIDAVATAESARLREAIRDASRTGSELGQRMVSVGNWPAARLLQEQTIESAAWQALAQAEVTARAALERLGGLMGLWQADELRRLSARLPAGLPALPETIEPGPGMRPADIESAALRADPMLALERENARRVIQSLPEGRWSVWEQAREQALRDLSDPLSPDNTRPPHIDDLRALRETRLIEVDEHRASLLTRASERRAMARTAWAQLQARHAGALHAQQVIGALQEARQQEAVLRYNGMFDSTWQLLAGARERLDALDAALMARRDYWRAQASWQALMAGAGFTPEGASSAPRSGGTGQAEGH